MINERPEPRAGGSADESVSDVTIDFNTPQETIDDADKDKDQVVDRQAEPQEPIERDEPEETAEERRERTAATSREGRQTRGESDADYGRRVQARINRERALRLRSDERVDNLTAANGELRDRITVLERAQKAGQITEDAQKRINELNTKIADVKVQLAAAKEAGDTAKDLECTIKLQEHLAEKHSIESEARLRAEAIREAQPAAPTEESNQDPERKRIERNTATWQQNNRKWWNLQRFRDVKRDAVELDKALRDEVSDGSLDLQEYSDEYFVELSTRLKQIYPDLDVRGLDGEVIEAEPDDLDSPARTNRNERRPPQRKPLSGGMGTRDRRRDGGDERTLAMQGRVRLGQADYAQMRTYNLDPNNEAHRKRFAEERRRTILSEGRPERGGGR